MSFLLRALTLSALLLPLGACGNGETTDPESAADAAAAAEAVAEVLCCGGNCDAPAGYCCSDGTCHGNHDELPLASTL
jgi:hypothetical protein